MQSISMFIHYNTCAKKHNYSLKCKQLNELFHPGNSKAAIESGVAKNPITDWEAYAGKLRKQYQE